MLSCAQSTKCGHAGGPERYVLRIWEQWLKGVYFDILRAFEIVCIHFAGGDELSASLKTIDDDDGEAINSR